MSKKKYKHPDQPIVTKRREDFPRFKQNGIVRHLLNSYPGMLNSLVQHEFKREDWDQFYQLIGYSVRGYGELSRVSDAAKNRADAVVEEIQNGHRSKT